VGRSQHTDFDGVVQLLCIVIRRQKNVKCARSSLHLVELRPDGARPTSLACTYCWPGLSGTMVETAVLMLFNLFSPARFSKIYYNTL